MALYVYSLADVEPAMLVCVLTGVPAVLVGVSVAAVVVMLPVGSLMRRW